MDSSSDLTDLSDVSMEGMKSPAGQADRSSNLESTSLPKEKKRRAKPVSTEVWVGELLRDMRKRRMNLYDLVSRIRASHSNVKSGGRIWKEFLTKIRRPGDPLGEALNEGHAVGEHDPDIARRRDVLRTLDLHEWGRPILQKEIHAVATMDIFARQDDIEKTNTLMDKDLSSIAMEIESRAPNMYAMLHELLQPIRLQDGREEAARLGPLIFIFHILCYSQQKGNASGFAAQLGVWLHGMGAKKSVIEVLCRWGLVPSYSTINRLNSDITGVGRKKICEATSPTAPACINSSLPSAANAQS